MDRVICKITLRDGQTWVATCPLREPTKEEQIAYLNRLSREGRVLATYELGTEADLMEYNRRRVS